MTHQLYEYHLRHTPDMTMRRKITNSNFIELRDTKRTESCNIKNTLPLL